MREHPEPWEVVRRDEARVDLPPVKWRDGTRTRGTFDTTSGASAGLPAGCGAAHPLPVSAPVTSAQEVTVAIRRKTRSVLCRWSSSDGAPVASSATMTR